MQADHAPEVRLITEAPADDFFEEEEDYKEDSPDQDNNTGDSPYITIVENDKTIFQKRESNPEEAEERLEKQNNLKQTPATSPANLLN